jgi:hypothetical protein
MLPRKKLPLLLAVRRIMVLPGLARLSPSLAQLSIDALLLTPRPVSRARATAAAAVCHQPQLTEITQCSAGQGTNPHRRDHLSVLSPIQLCSTSSQAMLYSTSSSSGVTNHVVTTPERSTSLT